MRICGCYYLKAIGQEKSLSYGNICRGREIREPIALAALASELSPNLDAGQAAAGATGALLHFMQTGPSGLHES
jgi:hypothetical protein